MTLTSFLLVGDRTKKPPPRWALIDGRGRTGIAEKSGIGKNSGMSAHKTRKRIRTPRYSQPVAKAESRAISLSANFSSLYAAIFNAMHEESGEAGGSSWEFQKEAEWRFQKALGALEPLQSDAREDALDDLVTASILYWCLRGSLDRPQKFTVTRDDLRCLREEMEKGLERLNEVEDKPRRKGIKTESGRGKLDVAYERDFMNEWDIRTAPVVADQVVRSRLFELKARQFLRVALRRLDALLGPVDDLNVTIARGQPRKYSKDFLLLRCFRLFEKYGRQEGVTRWKESNQKEKEPAYGGALVNFVKHVLGAVDPTLDLKSKYSLGKSLEEARRLFKRVPDADALVRQNSSARDLLRFANLCESIRAKPVK